MSSRIVFAAGNDLTQVVGESPEQIDELIRSGHGEPFLLNKTGGGDLRVKPEHIVYWHTHHAGSAPGRTAV